MDFGATISRALKITWQHKVLWLIALIPTLVGLVAIIPFMVLFFGSMMAGITSGLDGDVRGLEGMFGAGVLAAYCLLFVGYIAIIVVTLVTQGAMIEGVRQAEDEGRVQFGRAMRVGWQNAGKLFVSGLVIALPVLGILCIGLAGVMAVIFSAGGGLDSRNPEEAFGALFSGGLCAFLGLYCAIIIYSLLASGVYLMGERAIVLHNAGPMEGLRRGWQLFRANLGSIILLALLVIGIQMIFSFVLNIGTQFTLLPAMGPLMELGPGAGAEDIQRIFSGVLAASFGLAFILVMVVSIIWSVLFTIFNSAAWTLAYHQFAGKDNDGTTTLPSDPTPSAPLISELR
jgi:hypothetical protein